MSRSLEKLAQEVARFIEGAHDLCAIAWDRRGEPLVVAAAANCQKIFGLDARALRGTPAGQLFAGGARAVLDLTAQATRSPTSVLQLLRRAGGPLAGQQFSARITTRSVRAGTVGVVRDLSASQGETDAALRAADLSRFASLLAHEVRNPLSAVKIALQTLERNGQLRENDLRRARIAIREVGNIELLLNEVLEYARPPSLSRVPVDPRDPLREAALKLAADWRGRGVTIRLELPQRMPPVQADPARLVTAAQLLLRLGALAAEEQGGGEVVLSLRELPSEPGLAGPPQRRWELAVSDSGRTLTKEARERCST